MKTIDSRLRVRKYDKLMEKRAKENGEQTTPSDGDPEAGASDPRNDGTQSGV